jgi:hypothetical protein
VSPSSGPVGSTSRPPSASSKTPIGKVFRLGLTAIRAEILARDPNSLPGATSNHCFFCWHVLTRGLAEQVGGGGGQVGQRTGACPNFQGELLQLGPLRQ